VYDERRGPVLSSMDGTSRTFAVSISADSSGDDDRDIRVRVNGMATGSCCVDMFGRL